MGTILARPARGDDVDPATLSAARTLGYAGVQAFQRGDYEAASEKLEKALRVYEVPSLGLWSARALVKLGRLVEAGERYRAVLLMTARTGEEDVQRKAKDDAVVERQALAVRIPTLEIVLIGPRTSDLSLVVDEGISQGVVDGEIRQLDPGPHRLVARSQGTLIERSLVFRESEQKQLILDFRAPDTGGGEGVRSANAMTGAANAEREGYASDRRNVRDAGFGQRRVGWIAVGAGGIVVLVGAVTGLIVMSQRSSLDGSGNCELDRNQCSAVVQGRVDSYNATRTLSSIEFIAGSVVAGAGGVILLTAPKAETAVTLRAGPQSAWITAEF